MLLIHFASRHSLPVWVLSWRFKTFQWGDVHCHSKTFESRVLCTIWVVYIEVSNISPGDCQLHVQNRYTQIQGISEWLYVWISDWWCVFYWATSNRWMLENFVKIYKMSFSISTYFVQGYTSQNSSGLSILQARLDIPMGNFSWKIESKNR